MFGYLVTLELTIDVRRDPHEPERPLAGQNLRRIEHVGV